MAYLGAHHAEDLTALVAHDGLLDLVIEHGNREAAVIVGLGLKVDIPEVSELLVALDGVRDDVLAVLIAFIGRDKAPS